MQWRFINCQQYSAAFILSACVCLLLAVVGVVVAHRSVCRLFSPKRQRRAIKRRLHTHISLLWVLVRKKEIAHTHSNNRCIRLKRTHTHDRSASSRLVSPWPPGSPFCTLIFIRFKALLFFLFLSVTFYCFKSKQVGVAGHLCVCVCATEIHTKITIINYIGFSRSLSLPPPIHLALPPSFSLSVRSVVGRPVQPSFAQH